MNSVIIAGLAPAGSGMRAKYAALLCWNHLCGWPAVREIARQKRARGDLRGAAAWAFVADHATPGEPEL